MGALICLFAGLTGGAALGYVLGREDRSRCKGCLTTGAERYADGFDAGWRDGAEAMADRVRERHMDASGRIWMDRWDLEKIEEEMRDVFDAAL